MTPKAGFTVAPGGATAFVEDVTGAGIPVSASENSDGTLTLDSTPDTPASFSLTAPLRLLVDLVDVTRGKTVAAEVLGTGDASVAGQTFTLKQSPLTYLASGADFVSTLQVAVDGIIWNEADTFYGQAPDAAIYVVSQTPDAKSVVRFGDGVNGARLPSGSRVVAGYRYGAGAARPPAGRLTTILKPQQNLASIHNPVAVWGGADAEQPADVRTNAPKSVLTFGRAISGDDYETVAALAPGVTRARAYWTWDEPHQRSLVKVYVGDDAAAATSARSALAGADDPNRPVAVSQATPIELTVTCTLLIAPDRTQDDVVAAATAALGDPVSGLFSPASMAIGRQLYASEIEAALLVAGAQAVHGLSVTAGGSEIFSTEPVGWADPGEGSFYVLASSTITPQVGNGWSPRRLRPVLRRPALAADAGRLPRQRQRRPGRDGPVAGAARADRRPGRRRPPQHRPPMGRPVDRDERQLGDPVYRRSSRHDLVNGLDPRAQRLDVAKTIHYRRRKGTLAVLEEIARDVTGGTRISWRRSGGSAGLAAQPRPAGRPGAAGRCDADAVPEHAAAARRSHTARAAPARGPDRPAHGHARRRLRRPALAARRRPRRHTVRRVLPHRRRASRPRSDRLVRHPEAARLRLAAGRASRSRVARPMR